jgi:hypothetical protein
METGHTSGMTTPISDDEMRAGMRTTAPYTVVILTAGPKYGTEGADAVVWEHGRRNFSLRADGVLPIVCPVTDDSPVCGVGILAVDPEAAAEVMDADPGVRAGIFTYALHPCRSFPGDALPSR